jgi:hypothetical protein
MELTDYVQQVRDQLVAAAALGDARTQEIAGSLASATASAVQLALLSAVADAAEEITAALLDYPGAPTVSTRWEGGSLHVDVTGTDEPVDPRSDDGDATARISLRLTDSLKSEVDAAAAREGVSVNTWLARAASAAVRSSSTRRPAPTNTHRVTGWING